tara:strand:- start:8968 stop:10584 length:1617 start_codon:yes stop_codon:yes gene_type:complete
MDKTLIAGFHSGHDCSFGVLENGIPQIHAELERYIRLKEPIGDSLEFLFKEYDDFKNIKYFTTGIDLWHGGPHTRFPNTWKKMEDIVKKNDGKIVIVGHHQAHAANAFFSSNFEDALIITIDGGGEEKEGNNVVSAHFTVWEGSGNKINRVDVLSDDGEKKATNIGGFWSRCTKDIFGLSAGYPKGHQAGTVMAMGALGNHKKYFKQFYEHLSSYNNNQNFDYQKYKELASINENNKFDVAAALQRATEARIKDLLSEYVGKSKKRNLCISGGVSLNCVVAGKIYDWFENEIDNIYADPIPYDAGLALGAPRYLWHHILDNPRITWEDNSSSYLGERHQESLIKAEIFSRVTAGEIKISEASDENVVDLLIDKKIVSVYGGGSESGRRALGNRSILADPRHAETKDIVNERVKHRQWFRPFAPSILREEVKNWFVRDIDSPYMSFAIKFLDEAKEKVPAVVHFNNTARLQTVTKNDNEWYYGLIDTFFKKTGVPILLNTSFNDREPIVETPKDAINCFLGTQIDYLYFYELGLLIERK